MTDHDFRAMFEEHKDAVYQFAWRMTNSPALAEDIAQDVFLLVWRGEAELDASRGTIRSLLLGIARNLAWKHWRRDRRLSSLNDDEIAAASTAIESLDKNQALSAAVAALPPLQREALVLVTYEEMSLQEIADLLTIEVGTVKARLYRARENLKLLLAPCRPGDVRSEKEYGTAK
ncbi:MAG TPA: sigma-70 family RNA polymerase sigma factor [Bryobacteraceae bacterium]|jgi:RNA polymerase sigma-70 factor (ECF subfamily)|nr:sigma-70 family RNA polymerase sigma factor [Bryobacteraceae bacterium]